MNDVASRDQERDFAYLSDFEPHLKLVGMMLYPVVRDTAHTFVFFQKRDTKEIVVRVNDEWNMVPPPSCMFSDLVTILRRFGRCVWEYGGGSSFTFLYQSTSVATEVRITIRYDLAAHPLDELKDILCRIHEQNEAVRRTENIVREHERRRRFKKNMALGFTAMLIILVALLWWFR